MFHGSQGPSRWAKAKLVRYADDFVVLARYLTPKLRGYIEEKLETWMGLEINREKTRVVDLKEKKASLDFLGYTFRYDRDLKGRGHRYLNIVPSKKALQREQNRLREMPGYSQSHKPLPRLIGELNRHLKGWGNYFSFGRPGAAYGGSTSSYCNVSIATWDGEASGPSAPPEGTTHTQQFLRMGLRLLVRPRT